MNTPDQQSLLQTDASESQNKSTAPVALSINSLAREFKCSREFMRALIDEHRISPTRYHNTHPLYPLSDVLTAWLAPTNFDPEKMRPHERLAYQKAIKVEDEIRVRRATLLEAEAVRREWFRVIAALAQNLESLTDRLELEMRLEPAVLARIDELIDDARRSMYADVQHLEPSAAESSCDSLAQAPDDYQAFSTDA